MVAWGEHSSKRSIGDHRGITENSRAFAIPDNPLLDGAKRGILPSMEWSATTREAKEYLIDRIVAQARHDGVLLTDIEQKMLYFTEGKGWTLPDMMQVNSEFDRNYDQDAYESKIGQIIRRIHEQPDSDRDVERWDKAVSLLRKEDHYLEVLIDSAFRKATKRPRGDIARLIMAGVLVPGLFLPILFIVKSHVSNPTVSKLIGEGTLLALVVLVWFMANRRKLFTD